MPHLASAAVKLVESSLRGPVGPCQDLRNGEPLAEEVGCRRPPGGVSPVLGGVDTGVVQGTK